MILKENPDIHKELFKKLGKELDLAIEKLISPNELVEVKNLFASEKRNSSLDK